MDVQLMNTAFHENHSVSLKTAPINFLAPLLLTPDKSNAFLALTVLYCFYNGKTAKAWPYHCKTTNVKLHEKW